MAFKLMFETQMGANVDDSMTLYLRPETAQGIFANFRNVMDSTRVKVPFGIAQIGKSFRNEVTTKAFIFRTREFEQAELEFFCEPGTDDKWYEHWKEQRCQWYLDLGMKKDNLRLREHDKDELAHYAKGCVDVEYRFPFGRATGRSSRASPTAPTTTCVSTSAACGRSTPGTRTARTSEGPARRRGRTIVSGRCRTSTRKPKALYPVRDRALGRHRPQHAGVPGGCLRRGRGQRRERATCCVSIPALAPIKAAIFPLVKKEGMPEIARNIYDDLKRYFNCFYDEKSAVGRRYRRQDEAGTPFCVTIDGQTQDDQTVTVRERDSMEQSRVATDQLRNYLRDKLDM